jgi:hypothetical protein
MILSNEENPSSFIIILLRFMGKIILSRYFILIMNAFISYFIFKLLLEYSNPIPDNQSLYNEILEPFDGIGTILIGWGVALEERLTLRGIFYLINTKDSEQELWLDDICHRYGVGFLIFGLFSEILTACVRMPNSIIYTEGFNVITLRASEGLFGFSLLLLILFSWRLVSNKPV